MRCFLFVISRWREKSRNSYNSCFFVWPVSGDGYKCSLPLAADGAVPNNREVRFVWNNVLLHIIIVRLACMGQCKVFSQYDYRSRTAPATSLPCASLFCYRTLGTGLAQFFGRFGGFLAPLMLYLVSSIFSINRQKQRVTYYYKLHISINMTSSSHMCFYLENMEEKRRSKISLGAVVHHILLIWAKYDSWVVFPSKNVSQFFE